MPLPGRQRAHGLLTLEVPGEHSFDADEQAFLLSLAGLAGQALDRSIVTAQRQAILEELEERNIEPRGYTYALSRNVGEPVQRIWNFLKLVEGQADEQFNTRTRCLFTLAWMEAERVTERVDELRTLTRVERQALRPETLDLNVLLVQVRHDLEPITRERKVQWTVGALPKIQGDALLMWQVLMELLAFAIEDAWEREPAVIGVEAEALDGQVMLFLQSNGQGFAGELEERIFEVLDQSVPRKTAFGRLGLSNVRRALGRQGGWVRAEGRPGQGVRFSVALPPAEKFPAGERIEKSG